MQILFLFVAFICMQLVFTQQLDRAPTLIEQWVFEYDVGEQYGLNSGNPLLAQGPNARVEFQIGLDVR